MTKSNYEAFPYHDMDEYEREAFPYDNMNEHNLS